MNIDAAWNKKPGNLQIFNSQGSLILDRPFVGPQAQLELQNLTPGNYYIKISNAMKKAVKSFVKIWPIG